MGMSLDEVKKATVWEFAAITERWIEAHDDGRSGKGGKLSGDQKDEIWAWMQKRQTPLTLKEAREMANGRGTR